MVDASSEEELADAPSKEELADAPFEVELADVPIEEELELVGKTSAPDLRGLEAKWRLPSRVP